MMPYRSLSALYRTVLALNLFSFASSFIIFERLGGLAATGRPSLLTPSV
jgi:hypothetical protein